MFQKEGRTVTSRILWPADACWVRITRAKSLTVISKMQSKIRDRICWSTARLLMDRLPQLQQYSRKCSPTCTQLQLLWYWTWKWMVWHPDHGSGCMTGSSEAAAAAAATAAAVTALYKSHSINFHLHRYTTDHANVIAANHNPSSSYHEGVIRWMKCLHWQCSCDLLCPLQCTFVAVTGGCDNCTLKRTCLRLPGDSPPPPVLIGHIPVGVGLQWHSSLFLSLPPGLVVGLLKDIYLKQERLTSKHW